MILAFHAIVAGWMISYFLESFTQIIGLQDASQWLTGSLLLEAYYFVVYLLRLPRLSWSVE
ncbi:hypothetical protein P4S73_00010 [Paraglaciecola sp. Hal342]